GRGALLATAAVGRIPRPREIGDRRREELRGPLGGDDRGGMVPERVRRGLSVGAHGYRRHRLHRGRRPDPGEGTDSDRRAPVHRAPPQTRGRLIRAAFLVAAFFSAGGVVAAGAAAQVDTTARDSTARDSTARDTTTRLLPVLPLPVAPGPLPQGIRYTFTTDSLLFTNAHTLSDLLSHIPGVYVARGGWYGQAEPVLVGGRGAGAASIEVYWDGVRYLSVGRDSLALDPARIPLAPLERVDVIVQPAMLRVYLVTARPRSTAPTTQIGI